MAPAATDRCGWRIHPPKQREVAERLGIDHCTVTNWELNRTEPALRFLPAILVFLGYPLWDVSGSLSDRLRAFRREHGLSQAALAKLLEIDPGTLSRWERGRRVPTGRYARAVEGLMNRSLQHR
jgi:transcriptional regulator with XRE-family HTH domain